MKRFIQKLIQECKNVTLTIHTIVYPSKDSVLLDITFVSQFATPEFAEKVLRNAVKKDCDPNWAAQGATSPTEYAKWVTTTCGMACINMVLEAQNKQPHPMIILAKKAAQAGVYTEDVDGELSAMEYHKCVKWLPTIGLQGTIYTRLTLAKLHYLVSRNGYLIVSVNPNIRGFKSAEDEQVGGHLVLVTGYNKNNQTISIHNPSGFVSDNSHVNHMMPEAFFLSHFAQRGICVHSLT